MTTTSAPRADFANSQLRALIALGDAWGAASVDDALERVAAAAVPHLADMCIVDVRDDDGSIRRVAYAAVTEEERDCLRVLTRDYTPTMDSPQPAARVLRSGKPDLLPVVDEERLLERTRGPEHAALMKRLGLRSHLQVPVTAPTGEILATIAFGFTRSQRRYDEAHLQVAEQFAARAASILVEARRKRDLATTQQQAVRLEERLRLAVEGGGVGTWDMDPLTGAISWDARCREIYGVSPGEDPDYGRLLDSILNADDRPLVDEAVKRAFASADGRYEAVYRVRRASDGDERWVSATGRVAFVDGKPARFVGVAVDVTELRRAQVRLSEEVAINETLSRLGQLFARELDRGKLAQLVTDEATRAVHASFGAFFFNVDDDAGGKYMLYSLAGAPIEAFSKLGMPRATAMFGPTFRGEGTIRIDDVRADPRYGKSAPHHGMPPGHLPVVSYLAVSVVGRSGEVFGGLFFGHDAPGRFESREQRIAEGIAAIAAVAFENARLYQRVIEEQARAQRALDVARTAEQRKDEFLAMLSHELRNPLAPILTALSLMKMGQMDVERASDVIGRQVDQLRGLMEDLLDVSRITRGKIELRKEPVDAALVVADAVEMAAPLIESRRHHLDVLVAADSIVDGDRLRLAQIVANLLTNAARYTEPGGRIRVAVARADDAIELEVVDDGVGIPAHLLPTLWEPFVQGPRRSQEGGGGLGLGLTLVRGLAELHGGTVAAFSDGEGRGARFVVRLPAASGAVDARARSPARALGAEHKHRVLVVDDNADNADLLAELLRMAGHDVDVAYDGAEALLAVERAAPTAAILDLGLPIMDGFELARRLRARFPTMRLLAVSGYGQAEDKKRSAAAGFDAHFVKPVEAVTLMNALDASDPPVPASP